MLEARTGSRMAAKSARYVTLADLAKPRKPPASSPSDGRGLWVTLDQYAGFGLKGRFEELSLAGSWRCRPHIAR